MGVPVPVEVICTGTELLTGKLNTNAAFIGERLAQLGLSLTAVTVVGDDQQRIESAVQQAMRRCAVIILSGGLGPTFDDLTREAVAAVLGRKLSQNESVRHAIAQRFASRGVAMPANNDRQAAVIDGAAVLPNANGTAPGQYLDVRLPDCQRMLKIFLLPGPPRELQPMFESAVVPLLRPLAAGITRQFVLHCAGLSESLIDEKIRPVIEAERKLEAEAITFGILAHQMVVDIKARVTGDDELLVDETVTVLKHEFHELLGDAIFGEGHDALESVVGKLLAKHGKKLAVAESCTGGLLSQRITAIPGSSLYFTQGAVTYANEAKTRVLGVSAATLESFGAVSEQTAAEMAAGMRRAAAVDYALSITGIAGPSGGRPDKPVGLVYIGLSGPAGTTVTRYHVPGSRADIRERAATQALDLLRRELLRYEVSSRPVKS
jgi:nicotinamide-nucleotide amidase